MANVRTPQRLAVGVKCTRIAALTAALALSLTACGSVRPTVDPVVPGTSLEFTLTGGGQPTETLKLSCDPVSGTVPNPERTCTALSAPQKNPFPAPVARVGCTEVGGDGAVQVSGTWRNRTVTASYGQKTSCDIVQWRAVLKLVGVSRPLVTATP